MSEPCLNHRLLDLLFRAGNASPSSAAASHGFDDGFDPRGQAFMVGLRQVLRAGVEQKKLQNSPHPVLLDMGFYRQFIRPWMARWLSMWLRDRGLATSAMRRRDAPSGLADITSQQIEEYLVHGPFGSSAATTLCVRRTLSPRGAKLLNLGHDWIETFLPHCMRKIDRVSYGLFTQAELDAGKDGNVPTRRLVLRLLLIGCWTFCSDLNHL